MFSDQGKVSPRERKMFSHQEQVFPDQTKMFSGRGKLSPRERKMFSRQE
jgi:hypothetical protein